MNHAARQYAQTATAAMSPRELEASALLKAAARLQAAGEAATPSDATLQAALDHNRRLWTIFAASMTDPASMLPEDISARVLSLANFVFNHTLAIQGKADAANLAVLVRINRELAAGLRGRT